MVMMFLLTVSLTVVDLEHLGGVEGGRCVGHALRWASPGRLRGAASRVVSQGQVRDGGSHGVAAPPAAPQPVHTPQGVQLNIPQGQHFAWRGRGKVIL